jgi:hypothetical protein
MTMKKPPIRPLRGRVEAPDLASLKPETLLDRAQCVALLAPRVVDRSGNRPGDDERASRDRVRKRIAYDLLRGELRAVPTGRIRFGDLVAWAKAIPKWAASLRDLPGEARAPKQAQKRVRAKDITIIGVFFKLPETEPESHAEIHRLAARIAELEEPARKLEAQRAKARVARAARHRRAEKSRSS